MGGWAAGLPERLPSKFDVANVNKISVKGFTSCSHLLLLLSSILLPLTSPPTPPFSFLYALSTQLSLTGFFLPWVVDLSSDTVFHTNTLLSLDSPTHQYFFPLHPPLFTLNSLPPLFSPVSFHPAPFNPNFLLSAWLCGNKSVAIVQKWVCYISLVIGLGMGKTRALQ